MAEIRPNRAKRKLQAGEPILAPMLGAGSVPDLDSLEMYAATGTFDLAWVEMEHGPWTWRDLSDISRVCDLWGVTSAVRVNWNEPAIITRTLDRGIQGVLVPHVNSREEAERAVAGALYPPAGIHGMAAPRQLYGVDRGPNSNWVLKANDEIFVMVLLEERDVLRPERLKEILEVPGIDVFFVGPGDLSLTMGPQYATTPTHPEVQVVVREAIQRIVGEGKNAGTLVNDSNVEDFLKIGVKFLRYTATAYLTNGLRDFQKKVASSKRVTTAA
jgi:2-keto-3-deoxy-L-rhamnonate aldolase RhmA